MEAGTGRATDVIAFFRALTEEPFRYDFYQTLRRFECIHVDKPRWGCAERPKDEPIRLGQSPEMTFAPAPLASFETSERWPPLLRVRLFGLLGPNGPLPLHITEYARDRLLHANDPTLVRFLDLFHHRFLALFYRAWAQAQPHVNRDRPQSDRFAMYVGALVGVSAPAFRDRDAVVDEAKLFHVGALMRHVRNAEGLTTILRSYFRIPVRVEQFVGHWMRLDRQEQTSLGRNGATLGSGAVLGDRVWDRQHKFRICLGPLTLDQYNAFLPASSATPIVSDPAGLSSNSSSRSTTLLGRHPLRKLVDWVRLYLGFELEWDVRVVLKCEEVPPMKLGTSGRLGWTTWLGDRRTTTDADDLCLDAERAIGCVGHVEVAA